MRKENLTNNVKNIFLTKVSGKIFSCMDILFSCINILIPFPRYFNNVLELIKEYSIV